MKNSYFFPHDYHARHDPKLAELLLTMGCEGVGIYWCLVEMLYENNGYLEVEKIPFYAKLLNTSLENIEKLVNNYKLFTKKTKFFTSPTLLVRLKQINAKRKKARSSAKVRWDAIAMQSQCEGNAIEKEKKVKKERIDKVIEKFIFLKGWSKGIKDNSVLLTSIYKRHGKAAKELALIAKEGEDIEAMQWFAGICHRKNLHWTIETVIKWFPEWLKTEKKSEALKRLEAELGRS